MRPTANAHDNDEPSSKPRQEMANERLQRLEQLDRAALARFHDGDERAFEEIVGRYEARIRSFVLGIVGDRGAAEDAAQETFLAAYRKARSYRGEGSFRSWLYRIAFRKAQDELRRRGRAHAELVSEVDSYPSRAGTETQARQEARWDLVTMLSTMKPEHRIALLLREVAGLSYREIGDALGWSMANVQTRIHRARLELRERLEGSEREPPEGN
jgi:RNA polymerase sigma-70 factor (ECF subfamily)